jgi:predicted nucleotidyltransferase
MAGKVLVRNTCSRAKVDACYEPLIAAAIQTYRTLFEDELVDVRLMGSVARGEAIPGQSDIDFLALLREVPQPAMLERLWIWKPSIWMG